MKNVNDRNSAVLILSHGRSANVLTYDALRKCGYTGAIYIIVDDEDEQVSEYLDKFGDEHVIVFCKSAAEKEFDTGMVNAPRSAASYARNQCNKIAMNLGLTHFIEMDDDYYVFSYKYFKNGHSNERMIKSLDAVFEAMFDFLDISGAISIAPGQGGDYFDGARKSSIGGERHGGIARKCMNVFFCRTDRLFKTYGALNDDVTAYTLDGQRGLLFFTIRDWMTHQVQTQLNVGGMTDAYAESNGTYVKSFLSVMFCPSCVKISMMGGSHKRIHHSVCWLNCTPMIIGPEWRRLDGEGDGVKG